MQMQWLMNDWSTVRLIRLLLIQEQSDLGLHCLSRHVCLKLRISMTKTWFEPAHEIMVLFILRKLILQMRMHSHPVALDIWFMVGPFVYSHTSCLRTLTALARLRGWAGSSEPSLVACVISTIISWAGSIISLYHDYLALWVSKDIILITWLNEKCL